jgi:hypothetical protein
MTFGVGLYGPSGLSAYMDGIRFLMGYRLLPLSVYDFPTGEKLLGFKNLAFLEKFLTLPDYPKLFLRANEYLKEEGKKYPGEIWDAGEKIPNGKVYKDENLEIFPVLVESENKEEKKVALSYVCKPFKSAGKIVKEKVDELKVPKKFISKIVELGQMEIEGVVYKASDFKEADAPSQVIIIIDCPGKNYIKCLKSSNVLEEYKRD